MTEHALDARQIFLEAVENHAAAQWPEFLDAACGADAALRERVEALLKAHGQYNQLLDGDGIVATVGPSLSERPGNLIGPYKLLQQIGEGGFGVVFMAEQTEPVRRRVALKVIKPGMDTRQVIARFEAERQALAVMDHPHIARVLDAGATDSGRPYFVMELVRGTPITQYCDENSLTIRQRLELFAAVCQAIQHAHTKGIIHRDVKPTNVLVTRQDGQPVVKVIDFGIAKAMGQQLTDKTLFTDFAQMIGTPLYMSPEQAELSGTDIDTRSDIYSLGVLLYELLTGSTPVSKDQLKQAAFDEIRRIIREDEPPKPSARISTTAAAPSIAAQRHTEPAKLTRLVRGELDWIVMKALDKDRNRRYETASSFALDVERYLADEAVQACPPTVGYKLRKFIRRYKKGVVTASAFVLLLILGAVASTWQAVRATRAEGEARAAEATAKIEAANYLAVTTFVQEDLLGQADLEGQSLQPDRDVKVRTLLDRSAETVEQRFQKQPLVEAAIRLTIGEAYRSLGEYVKARPQLERAVEIRRRELGAEHADTLEAINSLGRLYLRIDSSELNKKSEPQLREALEVSQRVLGPEDPITLTARHQLALWHLEMGQFALAEPLTVKTLEDRRRVLGPDHRDTLRTQYNLALLYERQRLYDKAAELLAKTLHQCRQALGPEHPVTLACMNVLGVVYRFQGQFAKGEPLLTEALDASRRVLGTGHESTRLLMKNLAEGHLSQGQYDKAEPLLVESVAILRTLDRKEARSSIFLLSSLAQWYEAQHRLNLLDQKKYVEAEPILRELLDIYIPRNPWLRPQTLSLLGECLAGQQKYAEAEPLLVAGYEGLKASEATIPIAARKHLAEALARIVQLYEAWNKPEQAAQWRQKLDREQEQEPRRVEAVAHFDRGMALLKESKPKEAQDAFSEAVGREPLYPEAHFYLGWAQRHRLAEAEAAFAEAARQKPHYALAQYYLGWSLQAQGKAAEAEVAYEAATRGYGLTATNYEATRLGIGWALDKQGKWEEAIALYQQMIRVKPNLVAAHAALARLSAMCPEAKYRDAPRAVEAGKKAVQLAAQSPWNWQMLGWAQYRAGDWKASIEALEKSIELQTDPPGGDQAQWYVLAMDHWQLGEKELARLWYHRAVDWTDKRRIQNEEVGRIRAEAEELLNIGDAESGPPAGLSAAQIQQNKRDKVAATFRELVRHRPKDASVHYQLGLALSDQTKWSEAADALEQAIVLKADYFDAHFDLGRVLSQLKKPTEAMTAYREAARLKPQDYRPHMTLAHMLSQQGKLTEAQGEFQEVIRLVPLGGTAYLGLGDIYGKSGQWEQAAAAYGRAVALMPDVPLGWHHRASMCLYIGDSEGYRQACREMLQRLQTKRAADAWRLVEACSLAPDAISDIEPVRQLTYHTFADGTRAESNLGFMALRGLAEYRAGRHAEALTGLERHARGSGPNSAMAFAVLAMAHHRLGQDAESQAALASSQAIVSNMPRPELAQPQNAWHLWLVCQILVREAQSLLERKTEGAAM